MIRKPRRVSISDQSLDPDLAAEVGRALRDGWCSGYPFPFVWVHETARRDGEVLACLEAFDGGLAEVRLEDEPGAWTMSWQYVPGSSSGESYSGLAWCTDSKTWHRLSALSTTTSRPSDDAGVPGHLQTA